jgi:4a-hydroxytetrahydrobiopterin dehydratase
MERREVTMAELEQALAELPNWSLEGGKLCKEFKFDGFAEAMGWMMSVAIYADRIDHHPEWSNVYSRVNVALITHEMDALSSLDLALARRMEALAAGVD